MLDLLQVMAEVQAVVGHSLHPSEPLMTAGLDSLGGMELRRGLADRLGLALPVTLLYDYQSIAAITAYINSLMEETRPAGAGDSPPDGSQHPTGVSGEAAGQWDDGPVQHGQVEGRQGQGRGAGQQGTAQPSSLLKTLRCPARNFQPHVCRVAILCKLLLR